MSITVPGDRHRPIDPIGLSSTQDVCEYCGCDIDCMGPNEDGVVEYVSADGGLYCDVPAWAVVAGQEGHFDYVLADGLTEAEARELAAHEGSPFTAVPSDEIYR